MESGNVLILIGTLQIFLLGSTMIAQLRYVIKRPLLFICYDKTQREEPRSGVITVMMTVTIINTNLRTSLGDPVVKTAFAFQCKGSRFDPWSES